MSKFLKHTKTELIFYPFKKIYKPSAYLYIFKIKNNELQDILDDKEILDIIKKHYLDKISIIEQDDFVFIYIYRKIIFMNTQ